MNETVPQADLDPVGTQALETLRLKWGHLYEIGFDDEHGWWATRHGQVGALEKADTPGELDTAIASDCGLTR